MLQEEEEGESLSEQLERLLAKYEDPDAPQDATFKGGKWFSAHYGSWWDYHDFSH